MKAKFISPLLYWVVLSRWTSLNKFIHSSWFVKTEHRCESDISHKSLETSLQQQQRADPRMTRWKLTRTWTPLKVSIFPGLQTHQEVQPTELLDHRVFPANLRPVMPLSLTSLPCSSKTQASSVILFFLYFYIHAILLFFCHAQPPSFPTPYISPLCKVKLCGKQILILCLLPDISWTGMLSYCHKKASLDPSGQVRFSCFIYSYTAH